MRGHFTWPYTCSCTDNLKMLTKIDYNLLDREEIYYHGWV